MKRIVLTGLLLAASASMVHGDSTATAMYFHS